MLPSSGSGKTPATLGGGRGVSLWLQPFSIRVTGNDLTALTDLKDGTVAGQRALSERWHLSVLAYFS